MISLFVGFSLWLIVGVLALTLASQNRRWLAIQPVPHAACAIVTWPAFFFMILALRAPQFARCLVRILCNAWDDARDFLDLFIFSRRRPA